jgi:hypothetical protein
MSDLGHATLARRLYLHVLDGGQVTARDMARLVEKIEELEAENKLLSEGATIAHLRGAMDAHANRADDIWEAHKHWEGERKFALRQIVRWLKNTPSGEAEG